jgi:hypothetical protein
VDGGLEPRKSKKPDLILGENEMSIYEVLGIGYVITSTTFFTAQAIYFGAKGVSYMHRLVQRAQTEETIDLQRSLSIKRELSKVE